MAIIHTLPHKSGAFVDVTAGPAGFPCSGAFVASSPYDVATAGGSAYSMSATTGVIPQAAAKQSIWFGMRNGPQSGKVARFTTLTLTYFVHGTPDTAASPSLAFDVIRYASGNLGTQTTPAIMSKNPFNVGIVGKGVPSCFSTASFMGGQVQVATATAIAQASAVIDTVSASFLPILSSIGTPVRGTFIQRTIENDTKYEHMVELRPGEGFLIRNNEAIPSQMSGVLNVSAEWHEYTL